VRQLFPHARHDPVLPPQVPALPVAPHGGQEEKLENTESFVVGKSIQHSLRFLAFLLESPPFRR
jgi:hypothetical protein